MWKPCILRAPATRFQLDHTHPGEGFQVRQVQFSKKHHLATTTLVPPFGIHFCDLNACHVPGIVDSHAFMQALLADAEDYGASLALRTRVRGGQVFDEGSPNQGSFCYFFPAKFNMKKGHNSATAEKTDEETTNHHQS